MSLSQFNFYPTLTPARVVSTTNLAGTYSNGPSNSGVGATLSATTPSTLTIDSVVLAVGDRALLQAQTSTLQSGLYIVTDASSNWILERTADFQSNDQMKPGMTVSIGAGTVNAGAVYILEEPIPQNVGVDAIIFEAPTSQLGLGTAATKSASDNTKSTLASISGSIIATHIAQFADTSGTIQDGGVLGTAAAKAVSDNTKVNVASINGATTTNHVAQFSDSLGTIQDGGVLGQAAAKAVSDNTKTTLAAVTGSIAVNDILVAADTAGTVKSRGAGVISGTVNSAGGSATLPLTITGVTTNSIVVIVKSLSTTESFIDSYSIATNEVTVNMNTAPGSSQFSYVIFSASIA